MGRTLNAITIKSSNFLHRKIQKNKKNKTLTGQPKKTKTKNALDKQQQTTTESRPPLCQHRNRLRAQLIQCQRIVEWPISPVQAICKVSEVHTCAPILKHPKKNKHQLEVAAGVRVLGRHSHTQSVPRYPSTPTTPFIPLPLKLAT